MDRAARIHDTITGLPDGTVKVLVEGKTRARIEKYLDTTKFFHVEAEPIEAPKISPMASNQTAATAPRAAVTASRPRTIEKNIESTFTVIGFPVHSFHAHWPSTLHTCRFCK